MAYRAVKVSNIVLDEVEQSVLDKLKSNPSVAYAADGFVVMVGNVINCIKSFLNC